MCCRPFGRRGKQFSALSSVFSHIPGLPFSSCCWRVPACCSLLPASRCSSAWPCALAVLGEISSQVLALLCVASWKLYVHGQPSCCHWGAHCCDPNDDPCDIWREAACVYYCTNAVWLAEGKCWEVVILLCVSVSLKGSSSNTATSRQSRTKQRVPVDCSQFRFWIRTYFSSQQFKDYLCLWFSWVILSRGPLSQLQCSHH